MNVITNAGFALKMVLLCVLAVTYILDRKLAIGRERLIAAQREQISAKAYDLSLRVVINGQAAPPLELKVDHSGEVRLEMELQIDARTGRPSLRPMSLN